MRASKVQILLIIGALLQSAILVDSAAIAQDEHEHDDLEHHDSSDYYDIEISIKSYGEDCTEENTKCDSEEEGLICAEDVGKCDCNRHIGLIFKAESGKCEKAPVPEPPVITESLDNLLEEEDEVIPTTPPTASSAVDQKVHEHDIIEPNPVISINNDLDEEHVPVNLCEHVNCKETLGHYSKCEESTGQCVCHDTEDQNRPIVLLDGHCFVNRKINDSCSNHKECTATIKGNAWCHMDLVTLKQYCECEIFNYFDEKLQECLPFASDGLLSPCKTDFQCTGFEEGITGHGLGPNAICSLENGHCQCKLGPGNKKAFLYENYCFYEQNLGDECKFNRECEVSLPGQDVHCNNQSKTCACKDGNTEKCPFKNVESSLGGRRTGNNEDDDLVEDDGVIDKLKSAMGLQVPNFVFIMIIGAVVLLLVVIIAVFVLRNRNKYTVVRTHDSTDRQNT